MRICQLGMYFAQIENGFTQNHGRYHFHHLGTSRKYLLTGMEISNSTSHIELAALNESICGEGIEMRMQVPANGIVLHQAVPTVIDSFAPA
jgi:hypothetical protein